MGRKSRKAMAERRFDERITQARKAAANHVSHNLPVQNNNTNQTEVELNSLNNSNFVPFFVLNHNIRLDNKFYFLMLLLQVGSLASAESTSASQVGSVLSQNISYTSMTNSTFVSSAASLKPQQEYSIRISKEPSDKLSEYDRKINNKQAKPEEELKNRFFTRLSDCIDQGNLIKCRSDLVEVINKRPSQKSAELFEFLYENPHLISKFIAIFNTRHYQPLTDNFEAIERNALAANLKYHFKKHVAQVLEMNDAYELDRLLVFQVIQSELMYSDDSYLINYKLDDIKYTWFKLDPAYQFSTQGRIGLLNYLQEGDSHAIQWFLAHIQYASETIIQEYFAIINSLADTEQYKKLIYRLKKYQADALLHTINQGNEERLKKLFNFLERVNIFAKLGDKPGTELILTALDNNYEVILSTFLDYNFDNYLWQNPEPFIEYVIRIVKHDTINAALKLLFDKRKAVISKIILFSDKSQSLINDPKILQLFDGDIHSYYYRQLNDALEKNDLSPMKDELTILGQPIHANILLDYLLTYKEYFPKLLELWPTLFTYEYHGKLYEGHGKRQLLQSLQRPFNLKLSSALANKDITTINALLVFKYETFDQYEITYGYSGLDWSILEHDTIFSDHALASLLNIIENKNKSAAQWLVKHILQATDDEVKRCINLVEQLKNSEAKSVINNSLVEALSAKLKEAIFINDIVKVEETFQLFESTKKVKSLSAAFWQGFLSIPLEKRNHKIIDYFINHEGALAPESSEMDFLIQQKDIFSLKRICSQWPNKCDQTFILKALDMNHDDVAEVLLSYVKDFDKVFFIADTVRQGGYSTNIPVMTTLLHQCALKNKLAFAEILIARGAYIDTKPLPDKVTPLAVALKHKHFEFAWRLVDAYYERGMAVAEDEAFGILEYISEAYQRLFTRGVIDAGKLLFFRATQDTRSQIASAAIIAGMLAISILATLVTQHIQDKITARKQRQEFFKKAVNYLKNIPKLSDELFIYINDIDKSINIEYRDLYSYAIVFPLAIVRSDGRTYRVSDEEQIKYSGEDLIFNSEISPFFPDKFEYSGFRININLISYLYLRIVDFINNDNNLDKDLKTKYLEELNQIAKHLNLFDSIEACLKDPNTGEIMTRPCIAPDNRSYQVNYAGRESHFFANIPGMSKIKVYRNYDLEKLIDEHQKNLCPTQASLNNSS